jgi:hypothetical protein
MTEQSLEPIQQSKGVYRSELERTAFESWVAKMILSGYTYKQLADLYKEEFDRAVSKQQVSVAITKLRKEWKLAAREDTNMYINMELERLDIAETEAWHQYRNVGGTVQDTQVQDLFYYDKDGKNEKKRQSVTTVSTKEDPRLAMQWFEKILKIQAARRKVLKLEATVNINNIMAVKGYAYFNPGKDWSKEPPNLPEPNVIDAEFSEKRESDE